MKIVTFNNAGTPLRDGTKEKLERMLSKEIAKIQGLFWTSSVSVIYLRKASYRYTVFPRLSRLMRSRPHHDKGNREVAVL